MTQSAESTKMPKCESDTSQEQFELWSKPSMPKINPPKHGSRAIFGGQHFSRTLEGWCVSWECQDAHRLWCFQSRGEVKYIVCVVMFNPGSLSGDGASLSKDDTLRIIRNALPESTASLVLNLYSLATPHPSKLFAQWDERHHDSLDLAAFRKWPIKCVVYAYGDIGQTGKEKRLFKSLVAQRVAELRESMDGFVEVALPKELITASGNPKHPKHWKLSKLIEAVRTAITAAL